MPHLIGGDDTPLRKIAGPAATHWDRVGPDPKHLRDMDDAEPYAVVFVNGAQQTVTAGQMRAAGEGPPRVIAPEPPPPSEPAKRRARFFGGA